MLTVLPIQDKNTQKELCELCNINYNNTSFAYRADDGAFLGVCQFRFENDCGVIEGLKTAPQISDDEAMIIMLRTAMNFMHRCGLKKSRFIASDIAPSLIEPSKYSLSDDGSYWVDLDEFYISPCHYNKK